MVLNQILLQKQQQKQCIFVAFCFEALLEAAQTPEITHNYPIPNFVFQIVFMVRAGVMLS